MGKYSNYLNIYEKDVTLPSSKEVVKIKPLTTNQIKKLLVHENEKDMIGGERILDDVLKLSIISENENLVNNLLLQDRYFLFVQIRMLTKGSEHTYTFTCPKCNGQSIQKIDLKNLKIKEPKVKTPEDDLIEIIGGTLKLHMRYVTRGLQEEAYNFIDPNLNNSQKQVEMALANMAQAIEKIETPEGIDTPSIQEKVDLLGDLPSHEYEKIKDWFVENDFGLDLNIVTKCPYCSYKDEHFLPLTNFFQ